MGLTNRQEKWLEQQLTERGWRRAEGLGMVRRGLSPNAECLSYDGLQLVMSYGRTLFDLVRRQEDYSLSGRELPEPLDHELLPGLLDHELLPGVRAWQALGLPCHPRDLVLEEQDLVAGMTAAQVIWASSWASWVEDCDTEDGVYQRYLADDLGVPRSYGAGAQIMDVAPDPGLSVLEDLGHRWVTRFRALNNVHTGWGLDAYFRSLRQALEPDWEERPSWRRSRGEPEDALEALVSDLVMEGMGTGVAWDDESHRGPHGQEVPRFEVSLYLHPRRGWLVDVSGL